MNINRWKDENNEDGKEVKDCWDQDSDEEISKPNVASNDTKKLPGTRGKIKPKLNPKADLGDASGNSNRPLTAQELRDLQRDSDFKLTKQMLGMEDKDIALEFPLDSKEDFDKFHKNLVQKLWCYEKSPHYYLLLDKLFRDLCVPLEADELKNLSSTLNALFNEKVKVSKNKPKKKGTKGPAIKVERNHYDDDRDDYIDELDDIM